jgi:hypothetical protein
LPANRDHAPPYLTASSSAPNAPWLDKESGSV